MQYATGLTTRMYSLFNISYFQHYLHSTIPCSTIFSVQLQTCSKTHEIFEQVRAVKPSKHRKNVYFEGP
jgi:hypothetical protein